MRKHLYQRLVDIAPAERIPWHRLIREMLDAGIDNEAEIEFAIKKAEEAVGTDGPIDRYKVRLLMIRAEKTQGITSSDRIALLRKAYELSLKNTERHRNEKIMYRQVCEVAVRLVERGESEYLLRNAIDMLVEAAGRIMDPEMQRWVSQYERILFTSR